MKTEQGTLRDNKGPFLRPKSQVRAKASRGRPVRWLESWWSCSFTAFPFTGVNEKSKDSFNQVVGTYIPVIYHRRKGLAVTVTESNCQLEIPLMVKNEFLFVLWAQIPSRIQKLYLEPRTISSLWSNLALIYKEGNKIREPSFGTELATHHRQHTCAQPLVAARLCRPGHTSGLHFPVFFALGCVSRGMCPF